MTCNNTFATSERRADDSDASERDSSSAADSDSSSGSDAEDDIAAKHMDDTSGIRRLQDLSEDDFEEEAEEEPGVDIDELVQ